MAVTLGTSAGFVAESPSSDPLGTSLVCDGLAFGFKDTSPAGSNQVTEIGAWNAVSSGDAANMYVGIYSHDAVNNRPDALIGSGSGTVVASSSQWNKVTGLSIVISASTPYWITAGFEDVATANRVDYTADATQKYDTKSSASGALPSPWGVSDGTQARLVGVYAKYEAAPAGGASPTGNINGPLVGPLGGVI